MTFRFTCPHTSSQNGQVERIIDTINNMIHNHLLQASFPPSFWNYALDIPTYLLDITSTTTICNFSPTKILHCPQPFFTHLRTFSCLYYPNITSTTNHKLDPRITRFFLSYPSNHRGCVCFPLNSSTMKHPKIQDQKIHF